MPLPPRKRATCVQVAAKAPAAGAGRSDVIDIKFMLVHGFRDIYDKEWDYGASLSRWLAKIGNIVRSENIGFTANVFQFSMVSFVDESGSKLEKEFDKQRAKLFDKTVKLQTWERWTADAEATRTVFFFIAHGLGAWLVKDMLSDLQGLVIATRTLGLVPLDGLSTENEPAESGYINYVKGLCHTFRLTTPSMAGVDNLAKSLAGVDMKFGKSLKNLQHFLGSPADSKSHIPTLKLQWQCPPVPVWGVATTSAVEEFGSPKPKSKVKLTRRLFHSGRGRQIPNDKALYECIQSSIDTYLKLQTRDDLQGPLDPNTEARGTQATSSDADTTANIAATKTTVSEFAQQTLMPETEVGLRNYNTDKTGSLLVLSPHPTSQSISRDWERMYNQAGEYLRKGQLESAMNLCREAMKLLQRSSVESGLQDLDRVRIELQTEIITLLRGRYEDLPAATTKLQMLKHEFKGPASGKDQIGRWLAESFTLRGDHWSAARELEEALKKQGHVQGGPNPIPTDSLEDISLVRDIALTFAYLGFFTRAQRAITFLLKSLDTKLGVLRQNLDKLKDVQEDSGGCLSNDLRATAKDLARKEMELSSKRDSVAFAAAMIYLLVGKYEQALGLAQEAWRGLSSRYSPTNIKALDCSRLIAQLLALTSRNREAEGACSSTLRILSTELGPTHPQTLATMKTLVFLHRTHYRLDQAVATAKSLSDITASVMAKAHPQAVEVRAELASSLRFAGDYKDALDIYLDIVSESQMSYARTIHDHGFVHPDALRYLSELAHVYVDMGQLSKAEALVLDVLLEQQHTYRVELLSDEGQLELSLTKQTKDKYPSQSRETIVPALLGMLEHEYFLDEVRGIVPPSDTWSNLMHSEEYQKLRIKFANRLKRIGQDIKQYPDLSHQGKMLQVHPSLLHTLEILAEIRFAQLNEDTNLDNICTMLDIIVRWRQKTLGRHHNLTLKSQYQLALTKSQSGRPEDRKKAWSLFRTVFIQRSSRLGSTHPDTLSAKREFVITCASLEKWENPDTIPISTNWNVAVESPSYKSSTGIQTSTVDDFVEEDYQAQGVLQDHEMNREEWDAMERCSREIIIDQRTKPGPTHPETIKSLYWLFTLQSGLYKISAASRTMRTLLQRLRRTRVHEQRLMSSLLTEERIAGVCLDQNQSADALDILSNIVRRCTKLQDEKQRNQMQNTAEDMDGGLAQEVTASPEFRSLLGRCEMHVAAVQKDREHLVRAAFKAFKSMSDGGGRKADASVYLINSFRLARAASEWQVLPEPLPHSLKREMCQRLEEEVKGYISGPDIQLFEKRLEAACSLLEAIFPKGAVKSMRHDVLLLYMPPTAAASDKMNGISDHNTSCKENKPTETSIENGETGQEIVTEFANRGDHSKTISSTQLEKIVERIRLLISSQMGCNYSESDESVEDHLSESSLLGGGEEYGGYYF